VQQYADDGEDEDDTESEQSSNDRDDDDDDVQEYRPARTRAYRDTKGIHPLRRTFQGRQPRPKRRRITTEEDSSDENLDGQDDEELSQPDHAYPSPASHDGGDPSIQPCAAAHSGDEAPQDFEKPGFDALAKEGQAANSDSRHQNRKPRWEQLPYLILVQVMSYAAAPLSAASPIQWLLNTSRVCRAFAEPAITSLYKSPPLFTAAMVDNLNSLLAKDPDTTMFKYRPKIEVLRIDIELLKYMYKGRHIDLTALVALCPRLSELDLYHHKDMSPYRNLDENLRWAYPTGLFTAFRGNTAYHEGSQSNPGDASRIRLKAWRWSQRMMPKDFSLAQVKDIHTAASFSSLRKVTFVNYQRPSLHAKDADDPLVIAQEKTYADSLIAALLPLKNLKHLVIESSTAANEYLLPGLPKTLHHLELVNCWDVTGEMFSEYLVASGHNLRFLTLLHNQSLNLSFLPILASACPNLRSLQLDMTYYSHHALYNDSDPMYAVLLQPDEMPAWPRTLEFLELEYLRNWEADAAEMLFQSLVDHASNLPNLRHLTIKAMLDIPWRQRSELRDKWKAKLEQIFKRRAAAPAARLPGSGEVITMPSKGRRRKKQYSAPARQSTRTSSRRPRHSDRQSRDRRRIFYGEPDSDEDFDVLSELDDPDSEAVPSSSAAFNENLPSQGLCDVVDIRVDNQKPTETQYGMDDFLDSDQGASDGEWNGSDVDVDDATYAW